MYNEIQNAFEIFERSSAKTRAVFISSANNINNSSFQIASSKENSEIICLHFLAKSSDYLLQINDLAIKYGARVFVDCEQKGAYDQLVDDFHSVTDGREFLLVKPNEFSAKAIDCLVETMSTPLKPKCLILGVGDLGLKTAILLHSRNAELTLVSRNLSKANLLGAYLNSCSPRNEIQVSRYEDLPITPHRFDFIIGATSGYPVILPNHLTLLNPDGKILDAGTGCIAPETITIANNQGLKIYSLYSGDLLLAEITNLLAIEKRYKHISRKLQSDGSTFVSIGMIGSLGDVIVDDVNHPTRYIAVCDGAGGILSADKAKIFIKNKELKR